MDAALLDEPRQSEAETMHLVQPGSYYRRGPKCDSCESPGMQGVIFSATPLDGAVEGDESCLECGNTFNPTKLGYGPRDYGPSVKVLFPPDDDDIKANPYLNPEIRGDWNDQDDSWFWNLPLTELGNAQRLVKLHGHKFRHVKQWGFLVYDGRRWIRDEVGAMDRHSKAIVWEMSLSLENQVVKDRKLAMEYAAFVKASSTNGRIQATIKLAATEPSISRRTGDFDKHPHLLNCRNGIVDLTTGRLFPHDPAMNITQLVDIDYDPAALAPRWDRFLAEVCCDNLELVDYLHRAVGYTMTGETKEQNFFFLYGDGANGKSTFLETIRRITGGYSHHLPFEALLQSRNSKPEASFAQLPGKRFVTATEAPASRSWNESALKAMTGQDTLVGENKYEAPFTFTPVSKLWTGANERPAIHGTDEGIWRRVHPIPFLANFRGRGDPDLDRVLHEEAQGILAWAVRGAHRWYREGLRAPKVVTEALDEYRLENDVVHRFILDRCELAAAETTASAIALREFNEWCKRNQERPVNATQLGNLLRKYRPPGATGAPILKKIRGTDGRNGWQGLHITRYYSDEANSHGLDKW